MLCVVCMQFLVCICVCVCISIYRYIYIYCILASLSAIEKNFCSVVTKASDVFFPRPLFYSLSSLIAGNTQSATKFRNEDSEL